MPPALKRSRKAHAAASRKRVKISSSTTTPPAEAAVASRPTELPPNFESQFRDSQPESAVVAPTVDGSRAATEALAEDNDGALCTPLDARLLDTYPGLNWACIPQYTEPIEPPTSRKS